MRYISFLRGINVSGQKKIKMIDLKNIFESLNYKNVKTYVQSGNVVFDYASTDTIKLAGQIEDKISQIYGFEVKTIIHTADELENIISNNPFIKEPDIEPDKLHITFLLDIPEPSAILSLNIKKEENEKFIIISREVYLYCPNGYGNTKLNNAIFERKLKTVATTRNWKTINNLLELSKEDR
jgi:uncharacterized protein (DUF1697 family)